MRYGISIFMNLHLLARILAQPWAVQHSHLALLTQMVIAPEHHAAARRESAETTPARARAGAAARIVTTPWGTRRQIACAPNVVPLNWEAACACDEDALPEIPNNVTCILVWGILGRAWTSDDKWYLDPIEVDSITAEINAAPPGNTVVLWFRSPGGITKGIPENAASLRSLGKGRRILAWSDECCASAAIWLASQCERINATPTADLGSIGVYISLYDWTEYLEKSGCKLELFKAGSMKAMGLPGNPLSGEESAHLQGIVDITYNQFCSDVTRMRAVPETAMQGQCLRGADAHAAVLVDGFFPSSAAYFAAVGQGKV